MRETLRRLFRLLGKLISFLFLNGESEPDEDDGDEELSDEDYEEEK